MSNDLIRAQQAAAAQRAKIQAEGRVVTVIDQAYLNAQERARKARREAIEEERRQQEQERYRQEIERREAINAQAKAECEAALDGPQQDAIDAANAEVNDAFDEVLATNSELVQAQSETARMFGEINDTAALVEVIGDGTKVGADIVTTIFSGGWVKIGAFVVSAGVGLATDVSSTGDVAYKAGRDLAKQYGEGYVKSGAGALSWVSKGNNVISLFDSTAGYDFGVLSDKELVGELRQLFAEADPRNFAEKLIGVDAEDIDAQLAKLEEKMDAHEAAEKRHEEAKKKRESLGYANHREYRACLTERLDALGAYR